MDTTSEGGETSVVLQDTLHISDAATAESVLQSSADISHRLFDNIVLSDVLVIQSLLHGVVFRRCRFKGCRFDRSDFEGARFESCVLSECSFDISDIRSTDFVDCIINNSSFKSAHISDNFFRNSSIKNTSFENSTLIGNTFVGSVIVSLENSKATILHSLFQNCRLQSIRFADCTVLFTIFDSCRFDAFTINADALGFTFGLTPKDLDKFNLLFLGAEESWPLEMELAEAIISSFAHRKWPMHVAFAQLSYSPTPRLNSWKLIFDVVAHQIGEGRGITRDEIQFILRIAHRLAEARQLPFAALIYGFDRIRTIGGRAETATPAGQLVDLLTRELPLLLAQGHDALLAYIRTITQLPARSFVKADFVFCRRPEASPSEYIEYLARHFKTQKVLRYSPRQGSWVEPIQMTAQALVSVLISLYMLEGCLVLLTRIRARTGVLVARKLPASYLEYAQSPKFQMPPAIEKIVRQTYEGYIQGSLLPPPREADLTTGQLTEVQIGVPRKAAASRSRKKQSR